MVSKSIDISIVLNLHREAVFVKRTLMSLEEAVKFTKAKSALKFELIVVFDNSDEKTQLVISKDKLSVYDQVSILKVDNKSLGLSRNSGISIANGKWVTTCDADDLVSYNMFSELFETGEAADDKVVVFPEFLLAFGDNSHISKYYPSDSIPKYAFFDYHPYISRIFIQTKFAKQFKYTHADHKNGYAYEDWCYNSRLIADGFKMLIAKNTTIYYRQRIGSLMREASSHAARLTPFNAFLEPNTFKRVCLNDINAFPDGTWDKPSDVEIHNAFFNNPVARITTLSANSIDSAIHFSKYEIQSYYSNKHANGIGGLAYYNALESLSHNNYTDILLLPFMIYGGGEKYILHILNSIYEQFPDTKLLVISGEYCDEHKLLEKLPPMSDFVDLHSLSGGYDAIIDNVTIRLIEAVACNARIHIKPSRFTHRFINNHINLLNNNKKIYYRFCDEHFIFEDEIWRHGGAFNFLSDNIDKIDVIISDHKNLIENDKTKFSVFEDKFKTIYIDCSEIPLVWKNTSLKPNRNKIIWASRVSKQKQPELLTEIANELNTRNINIDIDCYGAFDTDVDKSIFNNSSNIKYKGSFSNFHSIDPNDYFCFLYTSLYDGLPNIILEAMNAGYPIISSDVGGICEIIENENDGILIKLIGNIKSDAMKFCNSIETLLTNYELANNLSLNAQNKIKKQHSKTQFNSSVKQIFQKNAE